MASGPSLQIAESPLVENLSLIHISEFADVIADEAVVDIHIRSVIEDVQRAVNIDFKLSLIHI